MNQNNATHYKYLNATGHLDYNMTNDYMFRMVLQRDKATLSALICSVLGLENDEVLDVQIENTIEPGSAIDNKEYQLDILVTLNNHAYINLEMQVINYNNWPERSLSYLCRRFDNVTRGKDYSTVKPVYHIGFLDFTLFEDHPEFFAKYQLRNAADNYLYTAKFNLFVIELNHTDMARLEDKKQKVDTWAKLFKANTWEEIKMITKENPSMNSTAETIFLSNSDYAIREQCRVREDNIAHEKYQKECLEKLTKENENLTKKNSSLTKKNDLLVEENARLLALLKENGITAETEGDGD